MKKVPELIAERRARGLTAADIRYDYTWYESREYATAYREAKGAQFDRWLAEEIRAAKNEAWGEACQALAWCFDNGPERDALPYLIEHNPFDAKVQS